MRRQRFPFLITSYESAPRPDAAAFRAILDSLSGCAQAQQEGSEKMSRVLTSLSAIEASLEDLIEGGGATSAREGADPGLREFYCKLVPVLDGVEAMRRAIERDGDQSWKQGMEMLSGKLGALLAEHGLQRAATVGMPFDPSRHESVGSCDAAEVAPGAVAEVVADGWLYRGEVLRYAKVLVARGGE